MTSQREKCNLAIGICNNYSAVVFNAERTLQHTNRSTNNKKPGRDLRLLTAKHFKTANTYWDRKFAKMPDVQLRTFFTAFMLTFITFIVPLLLPYLDDMDVELGIPDSVCLSNQQMDIKSVEKSLGENVFGQDLAINTVVRELKNYLKEDKKVASRPLVLSFNGWHGTGKTYVAQIISHYIPDSAQVFWVLPSYGLYPHRTSNETDSTDHDQFLEWMDGKLLDCTLSLFVFDDTGEDIDTQMEALEELLLIWEDNPEAYRNVKAMFILISNLGGLEINDYLYDFLSSDVTYTRLDAPAKELTDTIAMAVDQAITEVPIGYFLPRTLISKFIPFLPLERSHVIKCAEVELSKVEKRWLDVDVYYILEHMEFYGDIIEFSTVGCKRISTLISFSNLT